MFPSPLHQDLPKALPTPYLIVPVESFCVPATEQVQEGTWVGKRQREKKAGEGLCGLSHTPPVPEQPLGSALQEYLPCPFSSWPMEHSGLVGGQMQGGGAVPGKEKEGAAGGLRGGKVLLLPG